jgi:uncharacterized protein (TIGR02646 family)
MKIFEFSEPDSKFVSSYDGQNHHQWNSLGGPVAAIRKGVRDHCLAQQKYRCAYCRMEKKELHGMTWDVDHVIPKALHPQYLYEPYNLVVSCKACNIAKSDCDVLTRKLRRAEKLPVDSGSYKIVHPYFDVYSHHFELIVIRGRITHRPKNGHKAKETFLMCDLVRFSYAFGEWDDFNYAIVSSFAEFVEKCPPNASKDDIAKFMGVLTFTIQADFDLGA